jgi:hypothetical protein
MFNPYATPKAQLGGALAAAPRQVVLATGLLWFSFVAGAAFYLQAVWSWNPAEDRWRIGPLIFIVWGAWQLFTAILIWFIRTGRAWARFTFVAFLIAFLAVALYSVFFGITPLRWVDWLYGARLAVETAAMCLLYTKPGSLWFAPRAPAVEAGAS